MLLAVGVAVLGIVLGSGGQQPAGPPAGTGTERTGPLPVPPVAAPAAPSPQCGALVEALPAELASGQARLPRRALAQPAPPGVLAWGDAQHDPVVLRCGIERPAELTPTAELLEVSGVKWLRIPGVGAATWVAVDRPVYVALTVPDGSGTGPLQDVTTAVRAALPAVPVNTGG
ncbi:hypothetical protein GTS_42280 [Gandjariella thermophila]|uniref:DUF3515 domain-containing protein n=1 Tax=Gandjariella thermophila TaxID=1931992 RepID=A0A4D4J734_9PSEU|nr:hypothetical protein GTS_42280 [Gandjariella thermophila]